MARPAPRPYGYSWPSRGQFDPSTDEIDRVLHSALSLGLREGRSLAAERDRTGDVLSTVLRMHGLGHLQPTMNSMDVVRIRQTYLLGYELGAYWPGSES